MVAGALDLDAAAIEMEAVVVGERDGAKAEASVGGVDSFAIDGDDGAGEIAVGGLDIPEFGVRDEGGESDFAAGVGSDFDRDGIGGSNGIADGTICCDGVDFGADGGFGGGGRLVIDGDDEIDGSNSIRDVGCGHENAPVRDMDGIGCDEVDMAVDAGAGVPAGAPFFGIEAAPGDCPGRF